MHQRAAATTATAATAAATGVGKVQLATLRPCQAHRSTRSAAGHSSATQRPSTADPARSCAVRVFPPGGDPRSQSRSLERSLVTRCSTPTGAARQYRAERPQLRTQSPSASAPPAAYLNHQIPTSDERPRLSNTPCCSLLPPLLTPPRCQPVIWVPARCPSSPQAHAHTHRTLRSAYCSSGLRTARRYASARAARPDSPLHTRQASTTRSKSRRLQSPWQ